MLPVVCRALCIHGHEALPHGTAGEKERRTAGERSWINAVRQRDSERETERMARQMTSREWVGREREKKEAQEAYLHLRAARPAVL